jgi:TRAP transporter TAXI family solute receptor
MLRPLALVAFMLLAATPVLPAAPEARLVEMGTGNVTGVYFPVGVALCRLPNQERRGHGLRCSARPSGGSVANIEALRTGAVDLAIVQSDVQNAALRGADEFRSEGPFAELRAVMALHPEPLTVVARRDAGIARLEDLVGKRISVGNPGSGQRALWDLLMNRLGWSQRSFAAFLELDPSQQAAALCDGQVDAFVFAVGHPARTVQEATSGCDAMLVPAAGPAVQALVAVNPFYFATDIPGGLYAGNPDDVPSFGVGATLVTRADVPEDVIYTIVSAVFDDFEALRGLNQALANLVPEDMARKGLSAPLHPGAERYFRERGWID